VRGGAGRPAFVPRPALLRQIEHLQVKIDHRSTTRTIQINAGLLQQLNLPSPRPSARRVDKSAIRALQNQPLTAAAAEPEGASHSARYRRMGDTHWSTLGNEPRRQACSPVAALLGIL
jgi:hypothetical protein